MNALVLDIGDILYDFDTMVHSRNVVVAEEYLCQHQGEKVKITASISNFNQAKRALQLAIKDIGRDLIQGLKNIGYNIDAKDSRSYYHTYWRERHDVDSRLISTLQNLPFKLIVCTNLHMNKVHGILQSLGVLDCFDAIYTPTSLLHNKRPHEEEYKLLIEPIREDFGISTPSQIGMIDTKINLLEGAVQIGCRSILLGHRKNRDTPLSIISKLDYKLDSIYNIKSIVNSQLFSFTPVTAKQSIDMDINRIDKRVNLNQTDIGSDITEMQLSDLPGSQKDVSRKMDLLYKPSFPKNKAPPIADTNEHESLREPLLKIDAVAEIKLMAEYSF